jgi:DNA-binding LytR/AlgR family response regulator
MKQVLNAIAVDDEPLALTVVQSLCKMVPYVNLVGSYHHPQEAMEALGRQKTDLLFLDIRMPDLSGIEFLQQLKNPPLTIFTTAHSEHAVQSFELDAIDYLLKPFSAERFAKACAKALEMHVLRLQIAAQRFITVKSGYEQIKLPLQDLLFVQSAGNYVQFVLSTHKIVSRLTMSEAAALLPAQEFQRIHRSYIVSRTKITRQDRTNLYIGNYTLPIGGGYQ